MKTSAALLLAGVTFGGGILADRLLFREDKVSNAETPAVRAEPIRVVATEPPPELERPDSRLVIMPAPPQEEDAVQGQRPQLAASEPQPIPEWARQAVLRESQSRATEQPIRELAAQWHTIQLTPESMKDMVLTDKLKRISEEIRLKHFDEEGAQRGLAGPR